LLTKAATLPTAALSDVMGRYGALPSSVKSLTGKRVCGPAFNVELYPNDNLFLHLAIHLAPPGAVIVATQRKADFTERAPWGEIMSTAAKKKGIQGLVLNGLVRDASRCCDLGFPIFCIGPGINGCEKKGPGNINKTMAIGDVIIDPGDLIVGDDSGVVVVPRETADDVVTKAAVKVANEEKRLASISNGVLASPLLEEWMNNSRINFPKEWSGIEE